MTDKKYGFFGRFGARLKGLRLRPLNQDLTSVDKRLVLRLSGRRVPSWKQMKHLPRYLTARDRLTVSLLTAVIVVSLVGIGVKAFHDNVDTVPADGGSYTEASVGLPRFINPVLAASNDPDNDLTALIFSGLMRFDELGHLQPDLAESYEISDEGRQYTFRLKSLLEWHDGTAFTAGDVAATFSYIKNPAWRSPYQSRFKNVAVETPDDRTVIFRMQEAYSPFLSLLTIGILPAHLWEEVMPENAARAELNIKPVGTGPFKFKSLVKDRKGTIKSLTLIRNDRYHGQKPHLETFTFRYYPDFGSATDALLKNKVDGIGFLPAESLQQVDKLRTVRPYSLRLPQHTSVFFNPSQNIALKTKAVRQALIQGVDRRGILRDALDSAGLPVYGPILPGFLGFTPDSGRYDYDPKKAASLLDEADYPLGDHGIRQKTTEIDGQETVQPLKITLTTVDAKDMMAVAQLIVRDWRALGIEANLDVASASGIEKERIRPRSYEALLYGMIIGPDVDPFPFWHSSQRLPPGLNLAGFNNRRSDELLELARKTNDDSLRAQYYAEFQSIAVEEAPAIFLYSPTYFYIINREVRGVRQSVVMSPSDRFAQVSDWYVKTEWRWR